MSKLTGTFEYETDKKFIFLSATNFIHYNIARARLIFTILRMKVEIYIAYA